MISVGRFSLAACAGKTEAHPFDPCRQKEKRRIKRRFSEKISKSYVVQLGFCIVNPVIHLGILGADFQQHLIQRGTDILQLLL